MDGWVGRNLRGIIGFLFFFFLSSRRTRIQYAGGKKNETQEKHKKIYTLLMQSIHPHSH